MDSRTILAEIPRLRRYARALLGDRAAGDRLGQDTLERAWFRLLQRGAGSDLRPWLFGIMHNLRVDQLRRPELSVHSLDEDDFEWSTRPTQTDEREEREHEEVRPERHSRTVNRRPGGVKPRCAPRVHHRPRP